MNPQTQGARLGLAEIYIDKKMFKKALAQTKKYSRVNSKDARVWLLQARAQMGIKKYIKAAQNFRKGRELSGRGIPKHYLDEAKALFKAGGKYQQQAIDLLDQGVKVMGPLVVLEESAFEYERDRGSFKAAILRARRLGERQGAQARWALEEGKVWVLAKSSAEARQIFRHGLDTIAAMSERRRNLPATLALEEKLKKALKALKP